MVRLAGYEQAQPAQLSGGQRQRVALARALVNRPRVLLLDEPLGALDLKLREEMQLELKAIQQEVGITFIYVTHDQEEALTMSDRIAVFNRGPDRAGRHAGRGLRATGHAVRRRLRRDLEPPDRRCCGGCRGAPGRSRFAPRRSGCSGRMSGRRGRDHRPGLIRRSSTSAGHALPGHARCRHRLVVTEQNLATSSMEALAAQGRRVRLIWKREHNFAVGEGSTR